MHTLFPQRASAIFVCRSDMDLHMICDAVQRIYPLPTFQYDEHSTWEYGAAMGNDIGVNITKTDGLDTIR